MTVTALAVESFTAAQLFENRLGRPEPQQIASLILSGMTELDLTAAAAEAGHPMPDMTRTLAELATTLPYIQILGDAVAKKRSGDALRLFAARDAGSLWDYFAIVHGHKHPARLLPASMRLMRSPSLKDPAIARGFLEAHDLTHDIATNPSNSVSVIETGFQANIRRLLKQTAQVAYGDDAFAKDRSLSVQLVSANPHGFGEHIVRPKRVAVPQLLDALPHTAAWLGPERLCMLREMQLSVPLAISLQLLPHYNEEFGHAERHGDRVVAIPREMQRWDDLDSPRGGDGRMNDSIVNPAAAALVQFRVVQHALHVSGQLNA